MSKRVSDSQAEKQRHKAAINLSCCYQGRSCKVIENLSKAWRGVLDSYRIYLFTLPYNFAPPFIALFLVITKKVHRSSPYSEHGVRTWGTVLFNMRLWNKLFEPFDDPSKIPCGDQKYVWRCVPECPPFTGVWCIRLIIQDGEFCWTLPKPQPQLPSIFSPKS